MTKKKILVVDDEVSITRMLKRNLEAAGAYEVRMENSSAAVVAAAGEFMPDLILMDVMMPGLDGGEVAALLREDAALNRIPIIFLTAAITHDDVKQGGGASTANIYLAKPVKFTELTAAMNRCFAE